jgi:triphosphoribosyl-dephospho-CoA synthase
VRVPEFIANAFIGACRDELEAPKPGNVHVYADGHGMTAAQFEDSAAAAAGPLCASGARVGIRIRGAVEATVKAVGTNTNLGIILLCAPLAAAADTALRSSAAGEDQSLDLRAALIGVIDNLDITDATDAFAAIVRASPAGLGHAERHDVRAPPQVTLKQAMTDAADRDRVARQYAAGFADVFDLGMPLHAAAAARWSAPRAATLAVYLGFLSRFPDSHICRKLGADAAAEVCQTALKFDALLQDTRDAAGLPRGLLDRLLAWDAALKGRGINPGTSADLTVATLFAVRLQSVLLSARISG